MIIALMKHTVIYCFHRIAWIVLKYEHISSTTNNIYIYLFNDKDYFDD